MCGGWRNRFCVGPYAYNVHRSKRCAALFVCCPNGMNSTRAASRFHHRHFPNERRVPQRSLVMLGTHSVPSRLRSASVLPLVLTLSRPHLRHRHGPRWNGWRRRRDQNKQKDIITRLPGTKRWRRWHIQCIRFGGRGKGFFSGK